MTFQTPDRLTDGDLQLQPLENAETIPAHWYTDPQFLQFEQECLFKSSWQYIGAQDQLSEIGQHIVAEISNVPLIAVRGGDDQIRCFANVCRHRGGRLVSDPGQSRLLRCQYHGWSYGLDGKLIGTPKFDDKASLKEDQCRLPEYQTALWEGQVYVNLNPNAPAFDQSFAGITERMLPMRMTQNYYKRIVYPVKANWKVYVDNYLEGYHVPVVHPELSAVIDNNQYLYELTDRYSLQWSPIVSENNPYSTDGTAFYYWIFPNIMLNIMPGRVQVNSVVPTGVDSCDVYFDTYLTADNNTELQARADADIAFSEIVQKQDAEICESVQFGLASGTYNKGRIVPSQEKALHHFHDLLKTHFRKFI